jgi:hypothetical protein
MTELNKNSVKKEEKTMSVRIRGMKAGDEMRYATSGLHLAEEDRQYLPQTFKEDALGRSRPQTMRKMVPGVTYTMPESVAKKYLGEFVEEAYE